jgi:hypothetical protein
MLNLFFSNQYILFSPIMMIFILITALALLVTVFVIILIFISQLIPYSFFPFLSNQAISIRAIQNSPLKSSNYFNMAGASEDYIAPNNAHVNSSFQINYTNEPFATRNIQPNYYQLENYIDDISPMLKAVIDNIHDLLYDMDILTYQHSLELKNSSGDITHYGYNVNFLSRDISRNFLANSSRQDNWNTSLKQKAISSTL